MELRALPLGTTLAPHPATEYAQGLRSAGAPIKKGHLVNKAQLIDSIADGTGISKAVAEKMLDVTIETITRTLKEGDSITIVGFGTFKVSDRAARSGRNPRTGEAIDIQAAKVPKFSAGKALKDAIN
jgi:DNA-binding protein HU-beta